MYHTPTLDDACHVLTALDTIPRPYGDNEGDPINSDSIYYSLSAEHQAMVDHAEGVVKIYTRTPDQQPNKRAIGHLLNRGFKAFLNQDQYDPYRLVGAVETQGWTLMISDPKFYEDDF
ncbi:hypothetical protein QF043_005779 [Pseudomonas sp. W3I7]|uniref:hypothetical protein n=1 Tax=Pseudomonas sp. W3I7 TaxID=3042292 RepID=UPI00278FFB7A|nr:hypothetical protein [Pseudomonas sp. W3I7]MDQ0706987.1 hypothetical protein [Pseudomonas sp. W3I7]